MSSKAGVAAVDRAFEVLHAFRKEKPVLTLAELSRLTGLYKSTILRLLGSLERYGFVWQRADGTYQLGAGLLSLASVFQDSFHLREYVEPVLEQLVSASNESATFFIREGDDHVSLFRIDGRHTIRDYSIRMGDRRPLNRGAASEVLRRFANAGPGPFRAEDFTTISLGLVEPEMAALGAPVFGSGHKLVGALTLAGPIVRFTPDYVDRIRPMLIDAAIGLSVSLGESPSRFEGLRRG